MTAVNDSLSNDSLFYKTFMLIGGAFDLLGKNVPLTGTNCWASKVSHDSGSYSILANDFHSALYLTKSVVSGASLLCKSIILLGCPCRVSPLFSVEGMSI
jgi:hypothetical protein